MRFTTRVAILRGTEVRDAVGGVSYTLSVLTGHGSIPATIMPVIDEKRQERSTPDEEKWALVLAGHWPLITPSMWVKNGDDTYEVVRVSTTKRHRVTTVAARRASL